MNDAFVESEKAGETSHWKLLSQVVAEVETHILYILYRKAYKRGDYYPKQIYYCASEEEAMQFHSKYSIIDDSSLSAESRFVVETSRTTAASIRENQRAINDNIMVLRNDMFNHSCNQDVVIDRLSKLVVALAKHSGLPMDDIINDEAHTIPPQASTSSDHTTIKHRSTMTFNDIPPERFV
ncbi:hypothetical protein BGZ65_004999 [Modicella reniformis]|uniref:Uncharacterized protein n=1 Tax=Modicella reniformis TaxID=1440133 RepID=A0A9P6IY00_9FUNG|nr:hypothetical protein BGZ65_004999 [Modicella reniformis]